MASKTLNRNFKNNQKDINYVGKDFSSFKENLIDFTKTYFPNTYSDFNDASPGMVFIEMASYIGDVLSFYQDIQLKESLLNHATERKNLLSIAQSFGYKPKVTSPAITTLTMYMLVPSDGNGSNPAPDSRYYVKIKEGMEVSSNSGIIFRAIDEIDFSNKNDREIDVYERNLTTGAPTYFLITKKVKAISATEISTTANLPVGDTEYPTINLEETNIISIVSVKDAEGNEYYEVPYLAQESIFIDRQNKTSNANENLASHSLDVPYILEVKKVPRRFSTKINADNTIELQFGSGDVSLSDDVILPNTKNIGLGLANSIQRTNTGIDPANFLKTNTFGIAPAGKSLTIKYLVGGGISSNVNSQELNKITRIEYNEDLLSIDSAVLPGYQAGKETLVVNNLESATGGRDEESIEEIRQNGLAMFGSQNRAVTKQDYVVRALSMPAKYGSVAKVCVSADGELDNNSPASILANPKNLQEFTNLVESIKDLSKGDIQRELVKFLSQKRGGVTEQNNPFAINMYVLGYDDNKKLRNINVAVRENLKTYLGEYRMLTDGVNIIDGFIVNIGIDFEIITYANYNKTEVLASCLSELQEYFNIDNWTFNKPIIISEIELLIANIDGVLSVPSIRIYNICGDGGDGYSPNKYNIDEATKDKIIYPSLDPCVFEVKFPNKDIKGRAL